ncbi:MAG: TetR/AcrR family transcriptional regulator [Actinobacteria bacterium]|nr:TetR/AcrR family transcriptional regulator [Actinomycetota bacterium]MBV8958039.1 TetR/AcrR family transcriptional regulator [Actinomycetota bacterium]MBV9254121.1 TetR/AcrR family transcriptional regulator [Actinomycetota bacterium]MBV9666443.1 TetR/AcrR family transcriptional regulator [Actinomycetota bacterium]MBV9936009.1 TetR/AcrR family transcriptional regulator [Actinomycetota bacterium]
MPVKTRAPVGARRKAILTAAAELFADHGYHATSINDIGAAVEVTGPAIYRHFGGKVDILVEVIEGWMAPLMEGVEEIAAADLPSVETLDRLIDNFVDAAVDSPAAYAVMARERQNLPKDERRAIDRAHRRHVDEWVRVIREIHPKLSDDEARTLVHGVFGLATPAAVRHPQVTSDELSALVRAMTTEVSRRGAVPRRSSLSV